MKSFKDLKVIETAGVLAGPLVGQFFAELGAEVIKIEPPGGDVTRSWQLPSEKVEGGRSAYFTSANWGKQSLVLNLKDKAHYKILEKLVADADIIIANYKHGDAQKLGVDYETLRKLKPDIIYGEITGFGADSSRVGYDGIVQAEGGFVFMNGEPGRTPLKMPVALIDVLAAHNLKEGLLTALLERMMHGKGQLVSVSLIDAALSSLVNQATNLLVGGHIPQATGSDHPNIAPYGTIFNTGDKKQILLAIGNDKQFRSLCRILSLDKLPDDERFKTNPDRVRNRESLFSALNKTFSGYLSGELMDSFIHSGVPAGLVNNMEAVFEKHGHEGIMLEGQNFRGIKTFAASFSGHQKVSALSEPPALDEHRELILDRLNHAEK